MYSSVRSIARKIKINLYPRDDKYAEYDIAQRHKPIMADDKYA